MVLGKRALLFCLGALTLACGSSSNDDLFDRGGAGGAAAGAGAAGSPGGSGGNDDPAAGAAGAAAMGGSGGAANGTGGGASGGMSGTGGEAGGGDGGTGAAATGGTGGGATSLCGNGLLDAGEECDDANDLSVDGCTNSCQVQCSGVRMGSTRFENHCYWLHSETLAWEAASAACELEGGHLVTITSAAENEFLAGLYEWVWIGASDGRERTQSNVGTYAWVTGEEWTYENWAFGRPNAMEVFCGLPGSCYEHCAELEDDGQWNDLDCGRVDGRAFVCEWDPPGAATD